MADPTGGPSCQTRGNRAAIICGKGRVCQVSFRRIRPCVQLYAVAAALVLSSALAGSAAESNTSFRGGRIGCDRHAAQK